MTWRPTTDFEEEIVNLQPDHDFIFAALSEREPQPFYPRPRSHIEYAATKKLQAKKQQEEYEATGRFNDRLHVISEVQRIAGTKPLGQQPSVNDWDTDKDVETEVVAMMRHFGMGPSVEEPLNEKVTLATYPVKNGVEVMKNGGKKVPLLFNNNLFKLKPKVSTSPSMPNESPSSNSSRTNSNSPNEEEESFYTSSDHEVSLPNYDRARADRQSLLLQAERLHNYEKLNEDSLDDEITFSTVSNNQESFRTARDGNNTTCSSDLNESYLSTQSSDFIPSSAWYRRNSTDSFNNTYEQNSTSSDVTKESSPRSKTSSFLQRFIISDNSNESQVSTSLNSSTTSSSNPILPLTYANVAKKLVKPPEASSFPSLSTTTKSSFIKLSKLPQAPKLRFYTAREVYDMKRTKANQLQ